jgi:hypothetical protein
MSSLSLKASPAQLSSGRMAFRFVLLIGVPSFFADFTYEGSRGRRGSHHEAFAVLLVWACTS